MRKLFLTLASLAAPLAMSASEADLKMPDGFASAPETHILYWGFAVVLLGLIFGFWQYIHVKRLPAHHKMSAIGDVIFKTCSTYLRQQGKFLGILFLFIGAAVLLYFGLLEHTGWGAVCLILGWTIIGVLGSYSVAWYGIRMNTYANARMAFASLRRRPLFLLNIPLTAGMSIGIVLVCIELLLMLVILLFMPAHLAGSCFIGFAIGESLGASALRIAGGIFTKIADIGSDLMKVVFGIGEDDPRNPGVIADCTGDNAGDSVGPTADGFETYGVTGVALVSFILLAVPAVIDQVEREFAEVFGRQYPGVIETYRCADAELILITLGSIAGLARDVVDRLRAQGQRVGLLRIRYLRPMPADQIAEAVAGARAVAVLEKDVSFGAEGSVFTNVNSALQQAGITVPTCNFIGGLGGDDIKADDLATVFEELGRITEGEDVPAVSWIGIDGAWAETSPYAQEGDGAR